ncbi:sodium channel protein Nach-like [Pseudomyrmex gracilis]|uniref:sodium channel protein Nach-like n=1 Tax=Pseudomyrmex gracilis TaxID=219809 RepID=UPI000995AE28|nr:sodium channel protein Nach-like [Pseudomyrmex gracilis]
MKKHKVTKSISSNSISDTWYRKCSISNVKTYINRWFSVFCENTSLHGFQYISMAGSTIYEAAVWFVFCISAMIFCGILMLRVWNSYSNHPIATSIDTSNRITQVSFPGVTICNNNKIYRPHAEVFANLLHENNFTEEQIDKFFRSLPKLITSGNVLIDDETAEQILETLDMSVETLMKRLMQPCSALLVRCAWIGQIYDCNKIFRMVKSTEGFCCAFNMHYNQSFKDNSINHLHGDFTDSDDGRLYDLPGVTMILNASGSGLNSGLSVALNVERDTYKGTTRPYVGASVLVHDPIDFPAGGTHMALPGHTLQISVTCTSITAKDTLRDIPIEKRSCYLEEEAYVKISNEIRYNYESCLSICRGNQLMFVCDCLPFYYPEIQEANSCYLTDIWCLLWIEKFTSILNVNHTVQNIMNNFSKTSEEFEIFNSMLSCSECLPECTDLLFRTTSENNKFENGTGFESELTDGLDSQNISFVHVYFDDMFYIHYIKESTISWDVLLASFGGIFGLCLGGSVISVIELIYLLIRECFKRQSRKKREQFPKSLPPASEILSVSDTNI